MIAVVFGLVKVIVSNASALIATPIGAKDFAIVGGNNTVNVELLALKFEPPLEVKAPAGKLLT